MLYHLLYRPWYLIYRCTVNTLYSIFPGLGVTKYVCKEEELDKHEWREIISRLQSVRYRDLLEFLLCRIVGIPKSQTII